MRIWRAYIGWPCVHGSMYRLPPLLFLQPFYRPSVQSRNQETVPPSYHSTLPAATACHLLLTCRNSVGIPPGAPPKHHRATCHQHAATVSPCYLVRARAITVPPPCHRVTWFATEAPSCHRATWCAPVTPPCPYRAITVPPPCHRVTWCATKAPPCHRATWSATESVQCHRATWCATETLQCYHATWWPTTTSPCHRAVGPPPYRQDTSAYLRTPTHLV